MTAKVLVLGAGYAGAGAVKRLEDELTDPDITWVSDTDYHLVLHESHRVIRDPSVADKITIPTQEIASAGTEFIEGEVVDLDADNRTVELADGTALDYDYVIVALGSDTAFYGIPGLQENALTLKSLDDALEIHDQVEEAARGASRNDPAKVVIGGAGLSGIQSAGEVAEFRDKHRAPIDITLVEALDEIMPGQDSDLQQEVREHLEDRNIEILTDDPITEAGESSIEFDEGEPLDYDVLLWTGGITGRNALESADLEKQHNRVNADATFETSDERVFAVGDSAIVDQGDDPAPPTAQAAWQAADVVAANVANRIRGEPLSTWTYQDKGTLISVGEEAVAHDIELLPFSTIGGRSAKFLKKFVAARWIADLTSWGHAYDSWDVL